MTLDNLIDYTCARASLDKQNQSNITNLISWANLTIQDIASRTSWPWLASRSTITTATDTVGSSTITVDATLNSKTVAGTGTSFASTDVGRFIQFDSSNDWYKISAVASATSLTLETAYALATKTGMNFTIRTVMYNLPADCHKLFDVRQMRSPAKLFYVDTRMFDTLRPDQTGTGTPRAYYLFYYNNPSSATGQNYAISFDPIPSAAMIMELRYLVRPTNLAAGTDVPIIPVMYHNVILDGMTYQAFLYTNNQATGGMKTEYERGIERMIRDIPQTTDNFHVLQAVDQQSRPSNYVPFPASYGYPFSI